MVDDISNSPFPGTMLVTQGLQWSGAACSGDGGGEIQRRTVIQTTANKNRNQGKTRLSETGDTHTGNHKQRSDKGDEK